MKTVINAVNELKGELSGELSSYALLSYKYLKFSIVTYKWVGSNSSIASHAYEDVCTRDEFLATVAECETDFGKCNPINVSHYKLADKVLLTKDLDKELDMEKLIDTNLDWSKDDEYIVCTKANSITKCWTIGDKYKIKQSLKGDFVVDDLGRNRYKGDLAGANFTLQDKPTPIFTQEMVDNGVFPGVGMMVELIIFENLTSLGHIEFKNEVGFLFRYKENNLCDFMEFGSDVAFKPLTPPITPEEQALNDMMEQLKNEGICSYDPIMLRILIAKFKANKIHGVSFQPLTVEVK